MPGELVSAAAILAGSGAGTWVADKLLGPSFNALGEQIRAFAGDRLHKIFNRVAQKTGPEKLHELPPGFAFQFIHKASFSEDAEELTEMWANLLVDAGTDFKSKHSLFADILSQLGPDDARALDRLVPSDYELNYPAIVPVNIRSSIRSSLEYEARTDSLDQTAAEQVTTKLNVFKPYWPSRITNVSVPWKDGTNPVQWYGGGSGVTVSEEILIRQQLVDRFHFDLQITMPPISVEGILVTGLGLEFLFVCRSGAGK